MTHLTTLEELKQQIIVLASVKESGAPFFSCYLNLENGQTGWRDMLDQRSRILRRILKGDDLADLEEVLGKIDAWLANDLLPDAKGAAIFARGSCGGSFMLTMQFDASLPNLIAVYPTPNIYHLIELKEDYHRYVVLLALKNRVSIVAVNLGAATVRVWTDQSGLRTRVGSGWARIHYCVNQSHRGNRFVREKIAVLKDLMRAGGHSHLILAGDPGITMRLRHDMPNDLAEKLVDMTPASSRDLQTEVIIMTLSSFIEHEEHEQRTIAERLIEGLRSHNLAVAGSAATLDALRRGEVDTLVMASNYQPEPGWTCTACQTSGTEPPATSTCPQCRKPTMRLNNVREVLLRMADQLGHRVEIVEQADALMNLGGVGCLLRTQPGKQIIKQNAPAVATS